MDELLRAIANWPPREIVALSFGLLVFVYFIISQIVSLPIRFFQLLLEHHDGDDDDDRPECEICDDDDCDCEPEASELENVMERIDDMKDRMDRLEAIVLRSEAGRNGSTGISKPA